MKINPFAEKFIDKECAIIDWKEDIEEALFSLKNKFPAHATIFEKDHFLELAENYSAEGALEYLSALGQELSMHDLVLYIIDQESDQYYLYLSTKENSNLFEKTVKDQKIKFYPQKQARKKWGQPAARISLSARLPYEKYLIDGQLDLKYPLSIVEGKWIDLGMDQGGHGIYIGGYYTFLDLTDWKPKEKHVTLEYHPSKIDDYDYSQKHQLYCAIFSHTDIDENKNRTFSTQVKIGPSFFDLSFWEGVECDEEIDSLSRVFWIDDHVIICYGNKAWIIENAGLGGRKCVKILEVLLQEEQYHPYLVEMTGGEKYISLNGSLFKFIPRLKKDFLFFQKNKAPQLEHYLKIKDHIELGAISFEKDKLVYLTNALLVEIDVKKPKLLRKRYLQRMNKATTMKKYNEEWAVIYQRGYPDKNLDLIQFWHYKTDTWLKMSLGHLGKHPVWDIILHPDGFTLIYSEGCILKVDDLLSLVQKDKKNHFTPNPWIEIT